MLMYVCVFYALKTGNKNFTNTVREDVCSPCMTRYFILGVSLVFVYEQLLYSI